jgi:tetratricopeptide (TPR) repeat protein
LKPDYAEAYSNLGVLLRELGRLDEAEAGYTQAIALKPDYVEAHSNLGVTLQELGRLDEALASYNQAIALKPDYAEAHNNLGGALQELGRLKEAAASYTQAIALKPDYVEGARNLVKLPVGQLDSDALNLCEDALDILDDSLEYKIKYFFFQGNLLKHRGFIEQSFNVFCKANKLKLEVSKDRIIEDAKKNIDSLMRIDKWMPSVPELAGKRLAKLFIMGPSKSGKSLVEHILRESSLVKTLYESINHNGLIKNNGCGKDSSELFFKNLFSRSEGKLFYQGYKVVTSTNPGSIFYSDYLMDMLPNAYFIIVKRDLRDVSPEIFTSEYRRGNLYSYDTNEISKYLDVYNKICETLALKVPDRCLTVSFEDIIQAPEDVADRISRLVGSSLRVNHLKRNVARLEYESLFRNHYAALSNESKY